jgi:hypothetical protein
MNEKDDNIAHPGMVSKSEKTPDFASIRLKSYFSEDQTLFLVTWRRHGSCFSEHLSPNQPAIPDRRASAT